ncbi:MAG: PqqD family protein [Fimbriimonadales bacterium]|nr:PqqD family protein [Fimbriimonadales bacterium]
MLLKRFFKRRTPPQTDRKQALRLYPLRNAAVRYEQNDEGVYTLIVALPPRGLFGWFSRIFKLPREHRIELDEIGSTVWSLCDGRHQVDAIVQRLVQQYKLERREAEYSLFAFLNTLSRRGFIAYSKKRL